MDRVLFDAEFLRKLEYLTLVARRVYRGEYRGEHRSVKRGVSPDFADYRSYQAGDDFRSIDWNIFARLDRLFVKLYAEEEDLSVHLLLDASSSMDFGSPRKLDYARRVAAALGYIGIINLDRVGVSTFSASVGEVLPPHRGRSQLHHLFESLSSVSASGRTQLNRALSDYSRRARQGGLAVVVTDLMDEAGYEEGLRALRSAGFDVVLIQILDEEEIEPSASGSLKLTDMETGRFERIAIDARVLALYRASVGSYFAAVEQFSIDHQIEYLRASTLIPFEDVVLKYLRQGAHLHAR